MKSMDLLEVMGAIRDQYILDADESRKELSSEEKKARMRHTHYKVAAIIALVLACILFLQTPVGVAAVEAVKEQVSDWIESLFPPKNITLTPEGMTEVVPHGAIGREPKDGVPGFAMYIDTERFYGIEENGAYFVRQIPIEYDRESIRKGNSALLKDMTPAEQEVFIDKRIEELKEFYASLPPIEIEIRHITDQDYKTCAEETRAQMVGNWYRVDELEWFDTANKRYYFHVAGEAKWDAPHEEHRFIDDGKGGTFHIVSRFYMEAAGGAGYRFDVMIGTFTVLNS